MKYITDGPAGRQSQRPRYWPCAMVRWLSRSRTGFTFIELVTALILVGVLSAIATKSLIRSKSRAFAAAVESDLRNLAVAQEGYYASRASYFGEVGGASFAPSPSLDFATSPGVRVELRAGEAGWAARGMHDKLVDRDYSCAVYVGQVEPYPPAVQEGVVTCRPVLSGGNDKKDKKDKKEKNEKDKGNNGKDKNGSSGGDNKGNGGSGNNGNNDNTGSGGDKGGKDTKGNNGKGENGKGNGKSG